MRAYHSVVAVRYPDLCRFINSAWELGSFASGGIPSRPPGFQFVLWDTNARINGLVAVDLETLVSQVLSDYPRNAGFANGLFVMTTATDHKNNLNSSTLKKNYAHTLRVETIANSAGGTAEVAIVAQPSAGFLNGRFYPDGSPHGRHRRLLRPHHGWTHTVEILDSAGLPTRHDGSHRHGSGDCNDCLWHPRPQKRCHHLGLAYFQRQSGAGKLEQMSRWSLNTTPSWSSAPWQSPNTMATKPTSRRACDIDLF